MLVMLRATAKGRGGGRAVMHEGRRAQEEARERRVVRQRGVVSMCLVMLWPFILMTYEVLLLACWNCEGRKAGRQEGRDKMPSGSLSVDAKIGEPVRALGLLAAKDRPR